MPLLPGPTSRTSVAGHLIFLLPLPPSLSPAFADFRVRVLRAGACLSEAFPVLQAANPPALEDRENQRKFSLNAFLRPEILPGKDWSVGNVRI